MEKFLYRLRKLKKKKIECIQNIFINQLILFYYYIKKTQTIWLLVHQIYNLLRSEEKFPKALQLQGEIIDC